MSEQANDSNQPGTLKTDSPTGIAFGELHTFPAAAVVLPANSKLEGDDVTLAERLAAIERRLDKAGIQRPKPGTLKVHELHTSEIVAAIDGIPVAKRFAEIEQRLEAIELQLK